MILNICRGFLSSKRFKTESRLTQQVIPTDRLLLVEYQLSSFSNLDVQTVCDIWNEHFRDLETTHHINPLHLELSCLAKPYFEEKHLVIARKDGQALGFVQLASMGLDDLSDVDSQSLGISALCVRPHKQEDAVAACLLEWCESIAKQRQAKQIVFKPLLPNIPFFLGIGPADSLIGATSEEWRASEWLQKAGFSPVVPASLWELDLDRFHPPMDRIQIQIRRAAHVDRQVDEPYLPWWQACVLGHTDPTAFQLTHRAERRVLSEALFWAVAPELLTTPFPITWLWPLPEDGSEATADQHVFLLGESLRQLQESNVSTVRTMSKASQTTANAALARLGFQPCATGVVFEKRLS